MIKQQRKAERACVNEADHRFCTVRCGRPRKGEEIIIIHKQGKPGTLIIGVRAANTGDCASSHVDRTCPTRLASSAHSILSIRFPSLLSRHSRLSQQPLTVLSDVPSPTRLFVAGEQNEERKKKEDEGQQKKKKKKKKKNKKRKRIKRSCGCNNVAMVHRGRRAARTVCAAPPP